MSQKNVRRRKAITKALIKLFPEVFGDSANLACKALTDFEKQISTRSNNISDPVLPEDLSLTVPEEESDDRFE